MESLCLLIGYFLFPKENIQRFNDNTFNRVIVLWSESFHSLGKIWWNAYVEAFMIFFCHYV